MSYTDTDDSGLQWWQQSGAEQSFGRPDASKAGIYSGDTDMGFIAQDSGGGNYKRVPAGNFIGRCYSLIDLGTQRTEGAYGVKDQHKIRLSWELFGEDDDGNPLTVEIDGKVMPMTISKSYTVSLHEKASLRKDLAAWRGKDFTDEEAKAFDVSKLLGAYCMVNVTTSESNGKTYSNVSGLSRLPSALKDAKPAAVHKNVVFDLDAPDMNVFANFHEKLQDAIRKAPEFQAKTGQKPVTSFDDMPEDIPF
jgi:hypothetical protein